MYVHSEHIINIIIAKHSTVVVCPMNRVMSIDTTYIINIQYTCYIYTYIIQNT